MPESNKTTTPFPESLVRILRTSAWFSLILLLGEVFLLHNQTRSGGVSSPFSGTMITYMAQCLPLLLGLNWIQARLLNPIQVKATTALLISIQLIQTLPTALFMLGYPASGQVPTHDKLLTVLVLMLIQIPGLLLVKAWLLNRLGLWHLSKGLTAIGMEALLLLGFWQVSVLPVNLVDEHSQTGWLKTRMHRLRMMVETYAVDWEGRYPQNLKVLKAEAQQPGKNYLLKEPGEQLCQDYSLDQALRDFFQNRVSIQPGRSQDPGETPVPCGISYLPSMNLTHYFIYGYDKFGHILQDNQQIYFLSNS